ncbi:phylloplanin-like [Vigna umbellata]|uniref:phylloplanin-like n=1 Tax=Vigna umbellata TaxID=87088 RepID=UPI001F5F9B5D|nr:phylloplanin-like [Vigna umbellata]
MGLKHSIMFLLIAAMAIPQTKAQLGFLSGLLGSVSNIQGTVFCTSKDNVSVKAPSNPVFPDAEVQLVCGEKEFSKATTNADGKFSITMDPLLLDISSLLNGCNLVVDTPLSNCNTKLPSSGTLISNLSIVATPTIAKIIPSGFHYVPST